jgi:Lysyl oxidase
MSIQGTDLEVYKTPKGKGRTLLGITNEVANGGVGPLEIEPSAAPSPECDDPTTAFDEYTATQTIFQDSPAHSGVFERGVDTSKTANEIGCLVYHDHPKHNHWHVLDFSKYSLRSEQTAEISESQKVGFCLLDGSHPFPVLPGTPGGSFFRANCSFGNPSDPPGVMGISVGWSDTYGIGTPGQQIRVDGLPQGRYCLRSEADPVDNIIETDDLNNATEVRVRLNPAKLRVKRLTGPCLSG